MSHAFQLLESAAPELSIEEAFALALTDGTFHDITLQASDGVPVPANRTILALRSPVFRKMIFGNFQEATGGIIVNVDYPEPVVTALVEYIHTNKVNPVVELDAVNSNSDEIPKAYQEEFQTLLTLTAAAAYYGLPKLCHEVQQCLSSYVMACPLLASAVLEACTQEGPAISNDLKQSAVSNIYRLLLNTDFDAKMLERVSPAAVELFFVECKALSCDHLFLCIDTWRHFQADRHPIAKQFIQDHVNLKLIDPEILSTSVASSGLVTMEQLVEAFQYQDKDIQAKHHFKLSFTFMCRNPTWRGTNSATFDNTTNSWESDTLQCPILVAGGRYTWSVNIIRGIYVWLGVVLYSASHNSTCSCYAGDVIGGYGFYGSDGDEWSSGSRTVSLGGAARCTQGDNVTITLDLSSEVAHNGTLSVSVNGQPTIIIFADMLTKSINEGFVPFVSCFNSEAMIVSIQQF
jgi:BTB/POZ domain